MAIQAGATGSDTKLAVQKLARVLHYLDDVRTAYLARARRGDVAEETWFSPELEYHLWLDYTERAYHDAARASIKNELGVTFEYVLERQMPDISTFIDWNEYSRRHNTRFDMCGFGISIGHNEPPVPQAANDLVHAILEDLKAVDKQNTGTEKMASTAEGEKKATRSSTTQDKVESNITAKNWKPATKKQSHVEDQDQEDQDRSVNNNAMVTENSWGDEQSEALCDEDAIVFQAIEAEEKQDRRSSKQKHAKVMRHSTSPGKHEETATTNIWNKRFEQLHTFFRTQLLDICNVDIDEMPDDADLEAWHRSIDITHPLASDIIGYVFILRSISKLEEGSTEHIKNAVSAVGKMNKREMEHLAEEKKRKAQKLEEKMQETPHRGNNSDDGQIKDGRRDIEVDGDAHMERIDEMLIDQGMPAFLAMVARDTGIVQGINSGPILEISQHGSGDDDDATSTSTDAVLKRKRASSMTSTSSEFPNLMDVSQQVGTSQKTKYPATENTLASLTMETIFDFSDAIGSGFGAGVEHHATSPMEDHTSENIHTESRVPDGNTVSYQKRARGRPRKARRGQKKINAEPSQRMPTTSGQLYGRVIAHENVKKKLQVVASALQVVDASCKSAETDVPDDTIKASKIWLKEAAEYMDGATIDRNLVMTQRVCALLFFLVIISLTAYHHLHSLDFKTYEDGTNRKLYYASYTSERR
ncbi:hypothetical protein J3R83DRAFT_10140 [Lanmaoa asiatica]|nr:hypothetical protein J3R83DRAFT_10140 [Lanmaoa asiatica]